MLLAVLRETLLRKSFWESQHSSGCSSCGSLTAPSWAAGLSNASRTVSQPADRKYWCWHHGGCMWPRDSSRGTGNSLCPFLRETSPCACSGGGASARSPSCSSPPPGWGFYFEGPLLCKQPGLSPCWPGQRGGSGRQVMRQNSSGSRTKPPGMHVELELCCTCCLTSARAASSCLLKAWHSDERWSSCRLL